MLVLTEIFFEVLGRRVIYARGIRSATTWIVF
jgi:hypothetical protein